MGMEETALEQAIHSWAVVVHLTCTCTHARTHACIRTHTHTHTHTHTTHTLHSVVLVGWGYVSRYTAQVTHTHTHTQSLLIIITTSTPIQVFQSLAATSLQ